MRSVAVVVGIGLLACVPAAVAQPAFRLLDVDPALAGLSLDIWAMTSDGSGFGGTIFIDGRIRGFVLTDDGLRLLDGPDVGPSDHAIVTAMSDDGDYASGWILRDGGAGEPTAVRWGPDGVGEDLGVLGGDGFRGAYAYAISADGQTVVGQTSTDDGWQGFRWTEQAGMVALGDLQPDGAAASRTSFATGVSADGETVVGFASNGERRSLFRWTPDGGMIDLDPDGSGSFDIPGWGGRAKTITGAVRGVDDSDGIRAFRWLPGGGVELIDDLPGVRNSYGNSISDDGRVAVGGYGLNGGNVDQSFLWTPQHGMVDLVDSIETGVGIDLAGWELEPQVVSRDGRVVAGLAVFSDGTPTGLRFTPFVYELRPSCRADFNTDGRLDFFDFVAFVAAFGDQDPAADLDGDGLFLFQDVLEFVAAFGDGCTGV